MILCRIYPFEPFIWSWIAKFFRADFDCVGWNKVSYRTFFNIGFKRLKHFVNHFWVWWYVIQQLFTKMSNILRTLSNNFFWYIAKLSSWYLMISKVLVVKLEWDDLESTHQLCYFFVLLILPLPRRVSTLPFWANNNLLYLDLLRWPSMSLLRDCPFLFMNIF